MPRSRTLVAIAAVMLVNAGAWSAEREATPAVVNPVIRSPLRATISLDGRWDFAIDPKNIGDEQKWQLPETALPDKGTIEVPGCWEAQGIGGPGDSRTATPEQSIRPMIGSYVGTAWYKKEVNIPSTFLGKRIGLKIGGVNSQGWFYVNGTYVGQLACYCGCYKYDITDLVQPGCAGSYCGQSPQRRAQRQGFDELDSSLRGPLSQRRNRCHSRGGSG